MTTRQRLPDRRASTTFDVEAFGLRFTVTASHFRQGELGEIFIQNHKAIRAPASWRPTAQSQRRWRCNTAARRRC